MKTIILSIIIMLSIYSLAPAQLNVLNKLDRETKRRVDKGVDKGIDKGLDTVEEGVEDAIKGEKKEENGKTKDKEKKDQAASSSKTEDSSDETKADENKEEKAPELIWSKYDFVPGDKVIFEDNLEDEENGEFPSRWDLARGTIEIANFGGEDVIMFRGGQPTIVPYLKDSENDYLPDVFTVELDVHFKSGTTVDLLFWDSKNQKRGSGSQFKLQVGNTNMEIYGASSSHPMKNQLKPERWIHVSLAYTNGKTKAYMDDTRLVNIPHLDFNPSGISVYNYHASDQSKVYIKNIRIAEGGVKYYDRVLEDGKIVSNGIRFDIGKATLRPESMGVINKIHKLLADHSDLKFSVEGHTDSDGDDTFNQKLSEDRAETVMNTLVKMGIAEDRLSSKGFGESTPIDTNGTAEGKANNRRVEFVKM